MDNLPGQSTHTLSDRIFDIIIANDDGYAAFKNSRHTNYKRDFLNTLGIFESTSLFEKIRSVNLVIAQVYEQAVLTGDIYELKQITAEDCKVNFMSAEYE